MHTTANAPIPIRSLLKRSQARRQRSLRAALTSNQVTVPRPATNSTSCVAQCWEKFPSLSNIELQNPFAIIKAGIMRSAQPDPRICGSVEDVSEDEGGH